MGSGRRPLPFPPPTQPPPVADPHCCAPLRAREMGTPPTGGPKGRSRLLNPAVLRHGVGSGEASGPSLASSASALHPGATPLPGASQPKGGPWFALSSFPPAEVGHSRGVASEPGLRAPTVRTSPGGGVGGFCLGQGGRHLGGVPCGHVGDLPSAKRFPLSRSKNTKLGTPGAPQPWFPGPIPTIPPGWPSWVGESGRGC